MKASICELYKRRSCPHGKSGTTLVNGKQCKQEHPKRCFKFCDFGARLKKGCNKGKRCQYWHPRLCKHSMKNKECEDEQCTFQHLIFHRMQPGKQQKRDVFSYRRENTRPAPAWAATSADQEQKQLKLKKVSLASSGGQTPYPPTIKKLPLQRDERKDADEKSFLLKLIENMRAGFQEQIDGLKKEIVREIHNPPITIGRPHSQQGNHVQAEPIHPAFRAHPGYVHPNMNNMPYMMAHQAPLAQQWINQNQGCPPLSF